MRKDSFFTAVLRYLTIGLALALLVACIVPYTNSASLAFFSLAVPLLAFLNVLLSLYWIRKKQWIAAIPMVVALYGYFALGPFVMLGSAINEADSAESLSVMTYNVIGFQSKQDRWDNNSGEAIFEFVHQEKPDIVCFQEYKHRRVSKLRLEDYPYRVVENDFGYSPVGIPQAIYSNHEIIHKGYLDFGKSYNNAVYADVVYKKDTVRVYSLHLQSLNIRPYHIKNERSDRLLVRLSKVFKEQQHQATIVRKHMARSPYKNMVVGDFNTNQFTKTYFHLKQDFKDSFVEKGSGYGATINFLKFPFRIDFILADPSFEVVSHHNFDINLSDHEPIMASIKLFTDK